ncbi:MAG: Organic hydroperoxide resistance transcriptional regulator [bacterium ADurb.Bin157]|jgi:DNA-binding MarR family transcriptional regulator|nr:MarR family transcriptional regulator [Candidatus Riflebacteria bacterium]NLV95008.1 MarR family transcriptional regulator [Candidatus Riflebacteria bacterium]OQB49619.1 MAG: Organic hydroperoxide resistance transcriptional regulator [bacterium ADurb.Bin157]
MPKEDLQKLENQICFPLYAASRLIIKKYNPLLESFNITYTQYLVLMVLWENNGISVSELGEKLYLDSGTLTPVLKKMESSELLKRERSNKDERSVIVTLTPQGKSLKKRLKDIPNKMGVCINAPNEDIIKLRTMLQNFIKNMECSK